MSSRRLRSLSVAAVFGLIAVQTAVAPFGPAAGAQVALAPPEGTDKLLDGLSTLVVPPTPPPPAAPPCSWPTCRRWA
jgi:hypothetical protein